MEKRIRFGDLVRNSGRPRTITLWTDPKKDRNFSKAVKENRIITVIQDPASTRKGFGQIGFHEQPNAFYLAFPRPLPDEKDSRVIGINYDLLEEPTVESNSRRKVTPKAQQIQASPVEKKTEPARKDFTVRIRRTAILETDVEVTGKDQAEAERQALDLAKHQKFSLNRAAINNEIAGIRETS